MKETIRRKELTSNIVNAILRAEKNAATLSAEIDPSGTDITTETVLVKLLREQMAAARRAAAELRTYYLCRSMPVASGSVEDLARL